MTSKRFADTLREIVSTLAGLAGAFFVCGIIVAIQKHSLAAPFTVAVELIKGCFSSGYAIGQILYKATSLTFVGLAVALGFRAGFFNIGGEGQLYVGAFVGTILAITIPGLHPALLLPLTIVTFMLAAGLWAALAGIMKARFGAHEVITTIMLNFLATAIVSYFLRGYSLDQTVHTAEVPQGIRIMRLSEFIPSMKGSPANVSLFLAVLAVVGVWVFLARTRAGYEFRAVGLNPGAAEAAGISPRWVAVFAMAASGALAGLVGVNQILGGDHYFERDFSGGVGFLGIAVALLGRNHPVGVFLAALLFSAISYGGLIIQGQQIPRELGDILSAVVIFFVASAARFASAWAVSVRKRALARESAAA